MAKGSIGPIGGDMGIQFLRSFDGMMENHGESKTASNDGGSKMASEDDRRWLGRMVDRRQMRVSLTGSMKFASSMPSSPATFPISSPSCRTNFPQHSLFATWKAALFSTLPPSGTKSEQERRRINLMCWAGYFRFLCVSNMDQVDNASPDALEVVRMNEEQQENDGEFPVEDGPLVEEESESSGGEESDATDRKRILPIGDSFKNCNKVMPVAYDIFKGLYTGPWIRWSQIPRDTKNIWFDSFKAKFFWKDKHSQAVRRNWSGKCSQHLRYTLKEARETGEKPSWITQTNWNQMLIKWDDEKFKSLCEANKSHRACLKGSFCGGSKNTYEHVAEFKKRNKRRMTQAELMRTLFKKKKTGEWTGSKPQAVIDCYNELSNAFKEAHPEGMTEEDKRRLWAEAAGVNSKGQLYAQGSLKKMAPDYRNPGTRLPSSGLNDSSQMEDFRKSIEEDLRRSITEEIQKTMEVKIQQQLIQARQQEVRIMQTQRTQQMQSQHMQRYMQVGPPQYVDPMIQVDTPFMALLNSPSNHLVPCPGVQVDNSSPNPVLAYPGVQVGSSTNATASLGTGHMPPGHQM